VSPRAHCSPPSTPSERPWKDAPPDAYSANGHWGQYVAVVPSADVVVVRVGDDRNQSVDLNQLIPLALEVAR
jgi:CubicO group peptidase (beta-lactamase class C family)